MMQQDLFSTDHDTTSKQAPAEAPSAVGGAFGWPLVVRALSDFPSRPSVERRYRTAGFKPDHLATKKTARIALADALTATEDEVEAQHPGRTRERAALRDLRRRVEEGVSS
jgi:hypothetical protein